MRAELGKEGFAGMLLPRPKRYRTREGCLVERYRTVGEGGSVVEVRDALDGTRIGAAASGNRAAALNG